MCVTSVYYIPVILCNVFPSVTCLLTYVLNVAKNIILHKLFESVILLY